MLKVVSIFHSSKVILIGAVYIIFGGSEVIDSLVQTENMFAKSTTYIYFYEVQENTEMVASLC